MKIYLISSNKKLKDEITLILKNANQTNTLNAFEGGVDVISNLISIDHPDIVILEWVESGKSELESLEKMIREYSTTAFILIPKITTQDLLINLMRMGVNDVLSLPIVSNDLIYAVERVEKKKSLAITPKEAGKVIVFLGAKGGVGATFLACNFSYILAATYEKKVALLDLDLQFGDALIYISDAIPTTTIADLCDDISRLDNDLLVSAMVNILPNFALLASPEDAERSGEIKPQHVDALLRVAKSQYDYVVLDVGRTLNATNLKALDHADFIFLIIQTTLPCVRASKRLISVMESLGYDKEKICLIINRNEKNGSINVKDVELTSGKEVFALIPNSYECVLNSINQGVPVLNFSKNDPVTNAIHELAKKMAVGPDVKKTGWLSSLFHRLQPEEK
jgi:pilus assembly protein CpaE